MAYGNVTVQNRDIGADIWTQMLKQAQGLQSGSIDPWELPEYKQFQQQYQDWMDKFMKNLYSQATAKGMNPGAAMQQLKDQIPQQLGTAMQDFTTKAYGRIMPTAQGGINNFNSLMEQWLQKQQGVQAKSNAGKANNLNMAKAGVGAALGALTYGMSVPVTTYLSGMDWANPYGSSGGFFGQGGREDNSNPWV